MAQWQHREYRIIFGRDRKVKRRRQDGNKDKAKSETQKRHNEGKEGNRHENDKRGHDSNKNKGKDDKVEATPQ